ncbi:DUF2381 family protein [Vitiosangium sp. GDMCC 1.1324]|uniref:DUF2381 family protein n=1 Tax=Vitiosangium sp. (strain GDMCC 1.1324) TaxID=2138576 RepID=UPI00130EF746|nr:DUF2381 family protein [Vitiosangium sp. GDMCC 1.1324]
MTPPVPAPWDVGAARYVELTAEGAGQEHEVDISPGRTTSFVFNALLLSGGVVLEERELFHLVMVDEAHGAITLLPSGALPPGKQLRLTVRFADGAVPASVTFRLVLHLHRAEPQVNVYRQPRSAESYQQESRQERERAERCETKLARAEAEKKSPGGLVGALESRLVWDTKGIEALGIFDIITQPLEELLRVKKAYSYHAQGRVAVDVELMNTGSQSWTPEGAELVGRGGARLNVLHVWPLEPIAPDERRRVRIEAEATEEQARGTYVLKLWEADGPRTVTVRGVTFPQVDTRTHD